MVRNSASSLKGGLVWVEGAGRWDGNGDWRGGEVPGEDVVCDGGDTVVISKGETEFEH